MIGLLQRVSEASVKVQGALVAEIGRGLLLVPQFTLAADTGKGTRLSFSTAAAPETGAALFDYLVGKAKVASGTFGADMKVSLVNDGPVTFWVRAAPGAHP